MTRSYSMARGGMLRIADAAGSVVQVHTGAVWLTQEGDHRDYYLGAGSAFRVTRDGLVLAQATCQSTLTLARQSLYAPRAQPTTVAL